jgi:serine/threonine protein kinase
MAGNKCVAIIPPSELFASDSWLPSYSMGSFSNMHAYRWNMSRVTVRDGEEGILNRELDILASLSHPSLLLLMGQCLATMESAFRLVFEPIFLGSLYFCLHEQSPVPALQIAECARVDILLQVTDGLMFLAERDLVHRAVTSHAVQLTRPGVAKVGQLELTVHDGEIVRRPTDEGFQKLYNWLSPEVLGWDHTEARSTSDVYSLCWVIWELFTGEVPWGDYGAAEIVHLVKMGKLFGWKRNNLPHLLNVIMKQGVQERQLDLLGVRDLLVSIGSAEGQINTLNRLEASCEADLNMSSMQVMEAMTRVPSLDRNLYMETEELMEEDAVRVPHKPPQLHSPHSGPSSFPHLNLMGAASLPPMVGGNEHYKQTAPPLLRLMVEQSQADPVQASPHRLVEGDTAPPQLKTLMSCSRVVEGESIPAPSPVQQMYISQPQMTREPLEGQFEPLHVRVVPGLQSPPPSGPPSSLPLHQPPSVISIQVPPPAQEEASGGGYRRENRDPYDSEDDRGRYGPNKSRRTVSLGARSGNHSPTRVMERSYRSSTDREESDWRCEGRRVDDRRQKRGGERDKEHLNNFDSKEERRQEERAPHGPSRPGLRNKDSQLAMLQQQALPQQQYMQQQQKMAVNPLQFQVQFMLLSLVMTTLHFRFLRTYFWGGCQ